MIIEIIKAMLVGICAAAPVGPVLILVIQKTLCHGRDAGMMTGLGSAVADTVYATVGLLALSLIEDFVKSHSGMIMIIGGVLVGLIGAGVFFRKVSIRQADSGKKVSLIGCSLQSCGSALSNPAALAVMIALLAMFGLYAGKTEAPVWLLAAGVMAGELLYWRLIVNVLSRFVKLKEDVLQIVSRVSGAVIFCFGIFLIIKGIVSLI